MQTVRAKFHCQVTKLVSYPGTTNPSQEVEVELYPVSGTGGEPENKSFWEATPHGMVKMTITNPTAAEFFEAGKTYYLDFSIAE